SSVVSLVNLSGSAVGTSTLLSSGAWRTLTASIGPQFTRAQLNIQISTNSSQNPPDEVFVFDNIQFREPTLNGNSSKYSIFLDAGQTLTADLAPSATSRPQLQIAGPGTLTVTIAAAQPGSEIF